MKMYIPAWFRLGSHKGEYMATIFFPDDREERTLSVDRSQFYLDGEITSDDQFILGKLEVEVVSDYGDLVTIVLPASKFDRNQQPFKTGVWRGFLRK